MTKAKRILVALLVALCICSFAFAGGASEEPIKIIYTNDVHCNFEPDGDTLGYTAVSALKKTYEAVLGEERVTLIDAGDATQGAVIGTLSKGQYLVEIMNKVGYDYAILGNHEWDYGATGLKNILSWSNAQYINSNIDYTGKDSKDNAVKDTVPYVIKNYDGTKVAFIGVSTRETYLKSTPTYLQDGEGNYVYDFLNGDALYGRVQEVVNTVRKKGADFVIVVSHLGDVRDIPGISICQDLIANTYGVDVFIDGHSHNAVESLKVKNVIGKDVLYTQTGTELVNVGVLTIVPGEYIYSELVQPTATDPEIDAFVADIKKQYEAISEQAVAKTSVDLSTKINGVRAIRNHEMAIGDLCADAYRIISGADIAFANGGGIRADLLTGDISYGDIINVFPYGNYLCVCEATGQEILEALEWGASKMPAESGGFLQVSGLKYTIDTSKKSVFTQDPVDESFVALVESNRVTDVMVGTDETGYEPLDLNKTYTLACHNYKLKEGGDGFTMFKDNNYLQEMTTIDNQLLINYIVDVLGGTIGEEYAAPQGRITIK